MCLREEEYQQFPVPCQRSEPKILKIQKVVGQQAPNWAVMTSYTPTKSFTYNNYNNNIQKLYTEYLFN